MRFLERFPSPAILVGHGSGATISWLAADQAPHLVAAIVAIEPTGPPFTNGWVNDGGKQIFKLRFPDPQSLPFPCIRPYGLSDIPMGFVPPPLFPSSFEELLQDAAYIDEVPKHERFQPIPFVKSVDPLTRTECYLQDEANGPVRKLPNLKNIPQCVVTVGPSFHTEYDYATVAFLRQAGVPVSHLKLPEEFWALWQWSSAHAGTQQLGHCKLANQMDYSDPRSPNQRILSSIPGWDGA